MPAGPGATNLNPFINDQGVFNLAAVAGSDDGKAQLEFLKGVRAITSDAAPLRSVMISQAMDPPPPPEGHQVIGPAYELTPDGATFTPAIRLTITYDPADLPTGVDEARLTVAEWDLSDRMWVELSSTVDTGGNTVSISVSHLGLYAVLAHTRPAEFAVGNLTISPPEISRSEDVSARVALVNTGDLSGSCRLVLKVNGIEDGAQDVELAGGATKVVAFSIVRDVPGSYTVEIGGQSGAFFVTSTGALGTGFTVTRLRIFPVRTAVDGRVSVSVRVTNNERSAQTFPIVLVVDGNDVSTATVTLSGEASQTVEFQVAGLSAGDHTISVGTESASLSIETVEARSQEETTNWGGVVFAVAIVVAVMVVPLFLRRKGRKAPGQ